MIKPKVSILIPVYNRVDMITECIDSALSQDYDNLEIIVSDNCSTDGTWELCCQSYGGNFRVRLLRNDTNVGPVSNWLAAASAATGEYSKILFSDDLLLQGCISSLLSGLDADTGFVYSAALIGESLDVAKVAYGLQGRSRGSIRRTSSSTGLMLYAVLAGSRVPVSPGSAIFRTSDVVNSLSNSIENPSSPESLITGAGPDVRLFLDALSNFPYYKVINEPLCFFRAHGGSFSIGNQRASVLKGYNSAMLQFFLGKFYLFGVFYVIARVSKFLIRLLKTLLRSRV